MICFKNFKSQREVLYKKPVFYGFPVVKKLKIGRLKERAIKNDV
jgi:hypothetical protein